MEAGEALLHEGFLGGGEASSCCVRGTNTTMRKGLVLFRMEGWTQEPAWALVDWLNSAFTISPTPSMNDVLRAGGQCWRLQDLGRGFTSDKWAAGYIYTDGYLGTRNLWVPSRRCHRAHGSKDGMRDLKLGFQDDSGKRVKFCVLSAKLSPRPFISVNHRRKLCFDNPAFKTYQAL